ncbi:MAG: hypothetical protein IPN38_03120 [Flavobacteriales bacterium]|nr:hypothetical protein [Flavobacteriales bacterium]
MVAAASIGVEQPCRQSPAEQAHVVVLLGGVPFYSGQPRPGRLLPPRSLGKALRQLLKSCESRVREHLKALPPGRSAQAEALVAAYKQWEHRVRTRHLTPHHLRAPEADHFQAFTLPNAVRQQLRRQLAEPLSATAPDCRLRIEARLPITPCLRLLDKVAVYLRAPHYCTRSHRYRPFATGQWEPLAEDRVKAALCCGTLVVVVE